MMKNSFNLAIYDSQSMMIRRRNKFRLLLLILLVGVAVAGYFMAPQIFNWGSPQKNEEKVAPLSSDKVVPQPIATKEQIIKTIPLPSKEKD
jgi:uncharacterized protein involved in exopolysaccharide biosynthesis